MGQARRVPFISPVMPGDTGHGAAMRAGMCLDALAQACVALMREPERGRLLADAAHRRYRERYSMSAAAARVRAVYRSLR